MNNVAHECAAMAANMLDGELVAIIRKMSDDEHHKTPLQQAVEDEARRRDIPDTLI